MAKKNTDATTETAERAPRGSGLPTQAKELVVNLANEINKVEGALDGQEMETVEISTGLLGWLKELAATISDGQTKNLPPETVIAKAKTEQGEIMSRAGVDENGAFQFANEADELRAEQLLTKIKNAKAKIAKAKEATAEPETAEAGEQGE